RDDQDDGTRRQYRGRGGGRFNGRGGRGRGASGPVTDRSNKKSPITTPVTAAPAEEPNTAAIDGESGDGVGGDFKPPMSLEQIKMLKKMKRQSSGVEQGDKEADSNAGIGIAPCSALNHIMIYCTFKGYCDFNAAFKFAYAASFVFEIPLYCSAALPHHTTLFSVWFLTCYFTEDEVAYSDSENEINDKEMEHPAGNKQHVMKIDDDEIAVQAESASAKVASADNYGDVALESARINVPEEPMDDEKRQDYDAASNYPRPVFDVEELRRDIPAETVESMEWSAAGDGNAEEYVLNKDRSRRSPRRRRSLDEDRRDTVGDLSNVPVQEVSIADDRRLFDREQRGRQDYRDSRTGDDRRVNGWRPRSESRSRRQMNNRDDAHWNGPNRRKREIDPEDERAAKRPKEDDERRNRDDDRRGRYEYRATAPSKGPRESLRDRSTVEHREIYEMCDSDGPLGKVIQKLHDVCSAKGGECVEICRYVLEAACRLRKIACAEDAYTLLKESLAYAGIAPSVPDFTIFAKACISVGMVDKLKMLLELPEAKGLVVTDVAALWRTPMLVKGGSSAIMTTLCDLLMKMDIVPGRPAEEMFVNQVLSDLISAGLVIPTEHLLYALMKIPNLDEPIVKHGRDPIVNRVVLQTACELFISEKAYISAYNVFRCLIAYDCGFNDALLLKLFDSAQRELDNDLLCEIFKMIKSHIPSSFVNASYYEDCLEHHVRHGRVKLAISIVEHMGTAKLKPKTWESIIPVLRLAESWSMLEKFVLALNNFFVEGNNTIAVDVLPSFVSELITHCVAHELHAHAFWYHKYMMHSNLRRSPSDFKNLFLALAADESCINDAGSLYDDARENRYTPSGEEMIILVDAFYKVRSLRSAAQVLENNLVRNYWSRIVNPSALFETYIYADRVNDALDVYEMFSSERDGWPEILDEDSLKKFVSSACARNRYDVIENLVMNLRARNVMTPTRELAHQLIHIVECPDHTKFAHLAIKLFAWGVQKGACGILRFRELSQGRIHAEDCWSLYEVKLHVLRCLEWMHVENKGVFNRDVKIYLPLFFSETGQQKRVAGIQVGQEVKAMFRTCFNPPVDAALTTEREQKDPRDRHDSKERNVLTLEGKALAKWMEEIFIIRGGPFHSLPEVKDKNIENGSLDHGHRQAVSAGQARVKGRVR
ncbi:hypothetical protein HK101_010626, partial [Irineochytrium annulatum]